MPGDTGHLSPSSHTQEVMRLTQGQGLGESMEGETLADPTSSVGTLKPGLPHPGISLVPMARGPQRMETVIPHAVNPGDSKVVPSHTDFPHHQQVAPESLLHRGLPDTWAGGETLHQAQDTFLRDVVVTQTRREMRFGMGPWGSAPPWSPAQPPLSPPLQLSSPGGEFSMSECPFSRWRH